MAAYEEHCGGEEEDALLKTKKRAVKSLLKTKHKKSAFLKLRKGGDKEEEEWCPTPEEEEAIEGGWEHVPEDLAITKEDYVAWAAEEGIELDDEELAEAEALFEEVDTNGDGAHSKDEL